MLRQRASSVLVTTLLLAGCGAAPGEPGHGEPADGASATEPPAPTTTLAGADGSAASPDADAADASGADATTGFRFVDIPAADGIDLKANVIEPATPGLHPAIVFISSWGLNDAEYLAQGRALAADGYTVLSYTPRGFWGSGGKIDTAGPKDIADVSSVIDWLLANTTADPAHIGAAGVSYGAGISLIGSAFDPRIKAVAAMSGWSDLVASLYGGNTRHAQAVAMLQALADVTGKPSDELDTILQDFWNDQNLADVIAFAQVRSAVTYTARINANHPAIFMANAYGDSLFPPDQLVDFYGSLTGPKHLELAPGDHAVVEATGLVGLDNHVWTSVNQWFDHYLRGRSTPVVSQPPVVLQPITGGGPEYYRDWASVSTTTTRYDLGGQDDSSQTGSLKSGTPAGWSTTIYTGIDTEADTGVALLTNLWGALTGTTPTILLPTESRTNGAVWMSGSCGSGCNIRGIAEAHLTLTSDESSGTIIAYLYDVDDLGNAHLITEEPATWQNTATNQTMGLDIRFPATAYLVPSGHSLALVIDTVDPLFLDENSLASSITFSGPSWLDVALR
jgi:predicted acyl esterase